MSTAGSERHPPNASQAVATFTRLLLLLVLEKRILAIIPTYAIAVWLFSLIVRLTVQELVNTFAYSIRPIMIVTLAGTMLVGLLFMGAFRVLEARDVDLHDASLEFINACRGLMLDSHLSLFEGTLEENISLRREFLRFDDLQWALRFVELEDEVDCHRRRPRVDRRITLTRPRAEERPAAIPFQDRIC